MLRKPISVGIVFTLALALLAGCRYSPEPTQTSLTMRDSGRSVRLCAGDTLIIKLESNPTTGYNWQLLDS